ncbi:MAG TPA: XrtA/PEP-CTERM system histidine kinase PrsK [Candidatus Udaeobacter sp.]|nr:XrtA/PEP-CTERM system histidine kinase PrsK [Candidatus Udaeobacter sp.]
MVSLNAAIALAAAMFSAGLATAAACRRHRSIATWAFFAGMLSFALEALFGALWQDSTAPEQATLWGTLAMVTKSLLPAPWLCFSLAYSRGEPWKMSRASWLLVLATFLLPVGVALVFLGQLSPPSLGIDADGDFWFDVHAASKALNCALLVAAVLILTNLERTFRATVGTMRWRIKFTVIGLAAIFGSRIYTLSQALLFSGKFLPLNDVDTIGLLVGCALIVTGFIRSGFDEIDVYPSHAVLRTSLTIILVGAYLFVVGVLAQLVTWTGGWTTFQFQAFVVLLGFALLAILLLSNRVQQKLRCFVSRHFKRPQYDFRQIWRRFTQSTSNVFDKTGLCAAAARLISETFNALSVTFWLFDENERLVFAASTSRSERDATMDDVSNPEDVGRVFAKIRALSRPFDLEKARGAHAEYLRQLGSSQFRTGGNRVCAPLWTGDRCLGVAILADRVGGALYTVEEMDLLKCMGEQIGVNLLNLQLTEEIMRAKELEAFQAMSAFFVHDLKNAASTLSLTLQNLPVHFDDPAFRQDALRGIADTATRINELISRLGALRRLELNLAEVDMNALVADALQVLKRPSAINVIQDLRLKPTLKVDPAQMNSVVTNLLLNARDAVGSGGTIKVETTQHNGWAILSVADNGCGMSPDFLRRALFRPFQTTKKKGLGIGMFQSKMVVEAHQGKIQVESQPGSGTTVRVLLPLNGHAT